MQRAFELVFVLLLTKLVVDFRIVNRLRMLRISDCLFKVLTKHVSCVRTRASMCAPGSLVAWSRPFVPVSFLIVRFPSPLEDKLNRGVLLGTYS